MPDYRIIVASSRGGVIETAQNSGWTVLNPIREFSTLDSDDDTTLGDIGGIVVQTSGFVALARKD